MPGGQLTNQGVFLLVRHGGVWLKIRVFLSICVKWKAQWPPGGAKFLLEQRLPPGDWVYWTLRARRRCRWATGSRVAVSCGWPVPRLVVVVRYVAVRSAWGQ